MRKRHSHECSVCNEPHYVQPAHKESLTKIKVKMLKAAAQHVILTGVNDFKKSDLPDQNHSEYANFQKLRYHGLIAQVTQGGERVRDRWLITRQGWEFLRGKKSLHKYIMVKDNHTQKEGRSDVLVTLLDVLKGGEYLETRFEYFDDAGKMVGLYPKMPPEVMVQETLL